MIPFHAEARKARVGKDFKRTPAYLSTARWVVVQSVNTPVCRPDHTT